MTAAPLLLNQGQDIGWNGMAFQVPSTWQPTVIYPAYLFFELSGQPVFEIKWQEIRGKFSVQKGMNQLKKSLPEEANLIECELPREFKQPLSPYTASAFHIEHKNRCSDGLIIFCSACQRITLVQWHFSTDKNIELLNNIFRTFRDHAENEERLWAVYDIKTMLPAQAILKNHEFLTGKYTLCFEIGATTLTLYRFKPAAVILANKSLGKFGMDLVEQSPQKEDERLAYWNYQAKGLDRVLAKLRRKPTSFWMRLWHDPEQNVILGVKAEGKRLTQTRWLEKICKNFVSLNTQ